MAAIVESLAQECAQVQPLWSQLRVGDRARSLRRAAQAVVDELDELLPLFAQAHDRTPGEVATLEVLPAIDGLTWLAEDGAGALKEHRLGVPRGTHPLTRARLVYTPLGVVGVLGAADAPFAQPLWQVGAALLAGNGVVLAPHPRGELGAERIARLLARARLPGGLPPVAPAGGPPSGGPPAPPPPPASCSSPRGWTRRSSRARRTGGSPPRRSASPAC